MCRNPLSLAALLVTLYKQADGTDVHPFLISNFDVTGMDLTHDDHIEVKFESIN